MEKYDVVIIGSGLGGLECGVILSKEGYNVCVLEQSHTLGGCLQSFRRKGITLDTGIHYVGSMENGQILNQFFSYFGILDSLNIRKLDEKAFDVVCFGGEEYNYASGYDSFFGTLAERFPSEREGLRVYLDTIRAIGSHISVHNLKQGFISSGGMESLGVSAAHFIDDCVKDPLLRNVLAGTVSLYGGVRDVSPLYHHAMINHSNIEGAYRFVDGTQQIADLLAAQIRKNGGQVFNQSKVISIGMVNEKVGNVVLENGQVVFGDQFISNLHPTTTFNLLEKTGIIKKAYRTRLNSLSNSYGMFTVYMVLRENRVEYFNKNYFIYRGTDAWKSVYGENTKFPEVVLLSSQAQSSNPNYSRVMTIMCPMLIDEFAPWRGTKPNQRGEEYESLKREKAEQLIDFVSTKFPQLKESIKEIYTTTPLSYEDYTATPDGTAYGILKNYQSPLSTMIPTRTRISNLFLTGQHLNVHGALGVTLTAAVTCSELLGEEYLAKKIGNH